MTIKDSDIFGAATGGGGGGGSTVKKYVTGMSAEYQDEIRSRIDSLVYIRVSQTPATLTVTTDPALDAVNFCVDDQSAPLGTVRSMYDDTSEESRLKWVAGQGWLRNGSAVLVEQLPRPVPNSLKNTIGLFTTTSTANFAVNAYYVIDAVTDHNGTWMVALASSTGAGATLYMYLSTDDAKTWNALPSLPTTTVSSGTFSKLTTNGTGGWWFHNGTSSATGAMWYTANTGNSWVALTAPSANPPTVLKFEQGVLWYIHSGSRSYAASTTALVNVGFKSTNAIGSAWASIDFDRLIPWNAGHASTSYTTIFFSLDVLPDGSFWTCGCATGQQIVTMFYDAPANSWYCFSRTPYKNLLGAGAPMWFIGTALEGENLRVLVHYMSSGNSVATNSNFYEAVYQRSNKEANAYLGPSTMYAGNNTNYTAFASPGARTMSYVVSGNQRFISFSAVGNYASFTSQNISMKMFVNGATTSVAPIYTGANIYNTFIGKVMVSKNGTVLYFPETTYTQGIGRSRPSVGGPNYRSDGAPMADFTRIQ